MGDPIVEAQFQLEDGGERMLCLKLDCFDGQGRQ